MSKVTLLYPPQQALPEHGHKPEAALAYPYLAGALLAAGHEVTIYDACVGNADDPDDVFYWEKPLESGLTRYGVSDERILQEMAGSDVVGITSIFTAQETMALHVGKIIKRNLPDTILVAGGTNASHRASVFLRHGFDVVCSGESEQTFTDIADDPQLYRRFGVLTSTPHRDLDSLPFPAWHLHPNDRYWAIGRPHGAIQDDLQFRYAPLMTSRGCIFRCAYCHISGEREEAKFRAKSIDRVCAELERLRELGVKHVFIEDDTLFGNKRRGIDLLLRIREYGFNLWDINGINLPHLFRQESNRYVPDAEVLDVLQACGFQQISLPVESANQRIIDSYASRKWRINRLPVESLIVEMARRDIAAGVNYMIGYPDETLREVLNTLSMARRHRNAGAKSANVMLVIPLPGTALHDEAIRKGYLESDFDPDRFNWRTANMKNTTVPSQTLETLQRKAWEWLN
ncbi:B12-binding domain-containing radical SAM protein [Petrachloros mirabilis]